MTQKIKRICCLILSLVILVSVTCINVTADEVEDLEALFESMLGEDSEVETETEG